MIYTGVVIGSIISNKIAKPFIFNIKTGEDVADYLGVVDSCIMAKLLW